MLDSFCLHLTLSICHIILIRLQFEAEFLIPLLVTEYGADADRREGDLSMYAYRSLPFQYNMTRFVQECDQLSPNQQDETNTLNRGHVIRVSKTSTAQTMKSNWWWELTENKLTQCKS